MGLIYSTAPERAEELGMSNPAEASWGDIQAHQRQARATTLGIAEPEKASIKDIYLKNCKRGQEAARAHNLKVPSQTIVATSDSKARPKLVIGE